MSTLYFSRTYNKVLKDSSKSLTLFLQAFFVNLLCICESCNYVKYSEPNRTLSKTVWCLKSSIQIRKEMAPTRVILPYYFTLLFTLLPLSIDRLIKRCKNNSSIPFSPVALPLRSPSTGHGSSENLVFKSKRTTEINDKCTNSAAYN